jgi:hypothetical protein
MRTKSPLLVAGTQDGGLATHHPFEGLPAEILAGLYTLPGSESLAGLGGMLSYFNHFLLWEGPLAEGSASGWTLSGVTGAATITQPNVRHGEIAITADATANCDPTLAMGGAAAPAPFIYAVGKRLWCFARLKIATVASTELFFGLGTPDTEPTTTNTFPSDGIFFNKAAAATNLALDVRKDGTSTQKTNVLTSVLTDATYVTIGFTVNSRGDITPYLNGNALLASQVVAGTANIPGSGDPMQFMLGFRGASQIVTLDWLLLGQEI